MKRKTKPVQIELDIDEWWPLSRYAAKEKNSIRRLAKQQLIPLINELKKKFPREPIKDSQPTDDVL